MTLPSRLRRGREPASEGMAAVEFAVILSVFLMMLLGIVEFGYDWFLKHAITNACRDGCRYAVLYRTYPADNTKQMAPSQLVSPHSVQDVVDNYLKQVLPAGATWTVTCTGDGYTDDTGTYGDETKEPVTVTVTTTKKWSALGSMIPQCQDMTVTAETTMLRE